MIIIIYPEVQVTIPASGRWHNSSHSAASSVSRHWLGTSDSCNGSTGEGELPPKQSLHGKKKTWLNGKTSFCFNSTLGRLWPEVLQKGHAACFMEPGWSRISPTSWCFESAVFATQILTTCGFQQHQLARVEICFALSDLFQNWDLPIKKKQPSPSKNNSRHHFPSISSFFHRVDLVVSSDIFANFPKSLKAKFSSWGSTSWGGPVGFQWHDVTWTKPQRISEVGIGFNPFEKTSAKNWMVFFSPGKGESIYIYIHVFFWNHHQENIRSLQLVITWYKTYQLKLSHRPFNHSWRSLSQCNTSCGKPGISNATCATEKFMNWSSNSCGILEETHD